MYDPTDPVEWLLFKVFGRSLGSRQTSSGERPWRAKEPRRPKSAGASSRSSTRGQKAHLVASLTAGGYNTAETVRPVRRRTVEMNSAIGREDAKRTAVRSAAAASRGERECCTELVSGHPSDWHYALAAILVSLSA